MDDVLANARVRALLTQADDAVRLRHGLVGRGEDPTDLDHTLQTIFSDLGRTLFELARTPFVDQMLPEPTDDDPTSFTDEIDVDDSFQDVWYTDEVEIDITQPVLAEMGELDGATLAASLPPEIRGIEVVGPLELASRIPFDATASKGIAELRELLALPNDFTNSDELSVEASRVQWAAMELDTRLNGLPGPVQTALLGLLAARAQHLREHIEVDVGPKLALKSMRDYRRRTDLPLVRGLLPGATPEGASWADDARDWFALLAPESM